MGGRFTMHLWIEAQDSPASPGGAVEGLLRPRGHVSRLHHLLTWRPRGCNLSNDDGAAVVVGHRYFRPEPGLLGFRLRRRCRVQEGTASCNSTLPALTRQRRSCPREASTPFETVHTHGDSVICGAGGAVIIADGYAAADPGPVPTKSVIAGETAAARTVTAVAAGTPAVTPGSPGAADTPAAGTAQATAAGTPPRRRSPGAGTPGKSQTPSARTVVAARTAHLPRERACRTDRQTPKKTAGSIGS